MKKKLNGCNIYIFLWVIQYVHSPFHLYGDTVSVAILFGLFAWSLYYCYIAILKYNPPRFLKAWTVLLVLFTIYGVIRILFSSMQSYRILGAIEISNRQFLIEHWTSMLPIYPFYVFSKTGQLNNKRIKNWTIIFVGVAIIQYYYGRSIAISRLSRFADETAITNNMGYFIAMILPMMYFWREKPIIQYLGNAVLMAFVLLAVKRGAVLVGIIGLLMQLFHSIKKEKTLRTESTVFSIVIFSIISYYFVSNLMSTNAYFILRVENTIEGNNSSRGVLYSSLLGYFINLSDPISWLFGKGADGTVLLVQQQAHNDWLEILIDMGVVGFLVFLVFWIRAFTSRKRFVNKNLEFLFTMVIIMLFARTFFSMSINDMYISSTLVLGYCLANTDSVIENNQ